MASILQELRKKGREKNHAVGKEQGDSVRLQEVCESEMRRLC